MAINREQSDALVNQQGRNFLHRSGNSVGQPCNPIVWDGQGLSPLILEQLSSLAGARGHDAEERRTVSHVDVLLAVPIYLRAISGESHPVKRDRGLVWSQHGPYPSAE